jgi:hypothetical protein
MTKGISCSRSLSVVAGAAFGVAAALYWMCSSLRGDVSERVRGYVVFESELSSQIAANSKYSDENLDALRANVGRIRLRLGDGLTWSRLEAKMGERWALQGTSHSEVNGYSTRTGAIERQSPDVGDWPEIVAAVEEWEAIPGVSVTAVEMKTSGSSDRRSLDTARFLVSVRTRASMPFPPPIP